MLAAPGVSENIGVGPPPALAPGQAPPLPKPAPLAEPRSSNQVGFPAALTASVQQAERDLALGHLQDVDAAAITGEMSVLGRFLVTKKQSDFASFKTPDLRNVLVTGPYFHDGSMETLWDVVDHYNKGDGITDPWLDEDIQPLALTEPEIDDVVAFLASLTNPQYKEVGDQEFARQLAISKVNRPQRDRARAFGPKPKQPEPPPF